MKHTELPWSIDPEGFQSIILATGAEGLGAITEINGTGRSVEEDDANARFIVRAVNCHGELVEALEKAHEEIVLSCGTEDYHERVLPILLKAEAAMEKAKQ